VECVGSLDERRSSVVAYQTDRELREQRKKATVSVTKQSERRVIILTEEKRTEVNGMGIHRSHLNQCTSEGSARNE